MIVRRDQIGTLSRSHYLDFENRTAAWLSEHFPEDCALLGPNLTRERIREAVQVAARYGFSSQRDSARFAYLWFLIGPHFDLKLEFAWLRTMLRQPEKDPSVRMDRAFEAVATHIESDPAEALE